MEPLPDQEVYSKYLDDLRESGTMNMFGAGQCLEAEFGLSRADARKALQYWMQNFKEES